MELTGITDNCNEASRGCRVCPGSGRRRGWADCDGWGEMAGPEIADTGADTLPPLPPLAATFSDPIDVQAAAALLDFNLTVWGIRVSTDFSSRVHSQDWVNQRCIQYPAPVSSPQGLCSLGLSVQRADGRHPHGDARGNRVISYTSAVQAVLGHPVPTLNKRIEIERSTIFINLFINFCVFVIYLVMGKIVLW